MGVRIALPLQINTDGYASVIILKSVIAKASTAITTKTKKMSKFSVYLKDSYTELTQKTSWPTWSELQSSAVLVMVASVIFALVIAAMDFVLRHLMTFIYNMLY